MTCGVINRKFANGLARMHLRPLDLHGVVNRHQTLFAIDLYEGLQGSRRRMKTCSPKCLCRLSPQMVTGSASSRAAMPRRLPRGRASDSQPRSRFCRMAASIAWRRANGSIIALPRSCVMPVETRRDRDSEVCNPVSLGRPGLFAVRISRFDAVTFDLRSRSGCQPRRVRGGRSRAESPCNCRTGHVHERHLCVREIRIHRGRRACLTRATGTASGHAQR